MAVMVDQVTFLQDPVLPGGSIMQLGPWTWEAVDLNPTMTNIQMWLAESTFRTEIPAIRAGSVIGVVVWVDQARAAGTMTVEPTINGVGTGLTAVLDGTNTTVKVTTQAKDVDAFTAGQRLGIRFSTAGWSPTSANITAALLIEQ